MTDPLLPPPRRPAPEQLRKRVLGELDRAPAYRVSPRRLVFPVAAAAAAAAVVVGVTGLGGPSTIAPAQTASPAPTTSSAAGPTVSASPTPKAPVDLDVRPMTKAEIAKDTKSCRAVDQDDPNAVPQRGKTRTVFAMVQRAAGLAGPSSKVIRLLVVRDDAGAWVCEDGSNTSWSAGGMEVPATSRATPAVEVPNYGGGTTSGCGGSDQQASGATLYGVGEQVPAGQLRLVKGKTKGPWLTARPHDGLVHFIYTLRGEDASAKDVSIQIRFLDADGKSVAIRPYGESGTKAIKTIENEVYTCDDLPERPTPKALKPPKTDKAGVSTCLAMAKESADRDDTNFGSGWGARLTVSTDQEWGAVLSNGRLRFGCSLFPTREISTVTKDSTAVSSEAFGFALNPIELPEGESLWAAGRVPEDVTAVSYRLPGERDVAAEIADGYWMMKFHRDGSIGESDDVTTWDPVVVTVTRASGTKTFTLPFDEDTMCNQVSHGC